MHRAAVQQVIRAKLSAELPVQLKQGAPGRHNHGSGSDAGSSKAGCMPASSLMKPISNSVVINCRHSGASRPLTQPLRLHHPRAIVLVSCGHGRIMSRRRYVARGVPGGYRIWDNRGRRWWGDLYELCPDDLVTELNGGANPEKLTALLKRYRALKR